MSVRYSDTVEAGPRRSFWVSTMRTSDNGWYETAVFEDRTGNDGRKRTVASEVIATYGTDPTTPADIVEQRATTGHYAVYSALRFAFDVM